MKGATVAQLAGIILAIVFITIGLAILLPKMGKSAKEIENAKSITDVKDPSKYIEICTNFRNAYYLPKYYEENRNYFSTLGDFCPNENWQVCVKRCSLLLFLNNILSKRPLTCSDLENLCSHNELDIANNKEKCLNKVFNSIKSVNELITPSGLCNHVASYSDYNAICGETEIENTLCDPYNSNDPRYIINIKYLAEVIQNIIKTGEINE